MSLCGMVAKVSDRDIVLCEFDLKSRYYVHFQTNTLENGIEPFISRLWIE